MRKPEASHWKVEWDSHEGRQVRIVEALSKFAAKKLCKAQCSISGGTSVFVKPATKREIERHADLHTL